MNRKYTGLHADFLFIFLIITVLTACSNRKQSADIMDGEYWKNQGLNEIIPFWQKHIIDTVNGGFYLNLSREGDPLPPYDKHPAMTGRQIYAFCCAYLLSGREEYLRTAELGVNYLLDYAWDKEYGGWYDLLDEKGNPKTDTKTVPNQLYTDVGLAEYYFVTGDKRVLEKINESLRIRQTRAKDTLNGGYFQALRRDLSVADSSKSKHSHYGYTSSLLLNLMLFTHDTAVENFARELMDLSIANMRDENGWFRGFPSPDNVKWEISPRLVNGTEAVSAGAQLTATLSLLRLAEITGDKKYSDTGLSLGRQLMNSAYDPSRNVWFDNIAARPPFSALDTANVWWWLQSYGMFIQLHLYNLTGEDHYLDSFSGMASFWSEHFVDREYGGAYLNVSPTGRVLNTAKASPWKASYHEMETALLNYLYLNLYVNREPVTLNFCISKADEGEKHYVSLAESPDVIIDKVTIDGKVWSSFDSEDRSVTLPQGNNLKITVTLKQTEK
ncbi:MAG TPA: AGE family epimerase/isomerase [Bacteroidales bacterium]|nr:AGE family epimerase/isomerase [Bacteroidales bacterium]